ncbi:parvulin-like peptidyl-prolyl isomerase [Terriglobus roseus DSM 18391]|uniref:Periplasmic chaperone PpiD n=1 Tax=Terriglobus roseus (strain DSM 18391 / NRRL B-41598 / KBS 63) TaxID=926566 RepID=I3ZFH8_TERRK|nr:peptidylprolyl isomerase [Terriglobus roseus]AFL87996.1 parvulin-like peptidyl-prolyl isomerase [Terriglobus roseus DSM 18391]
MIRALQKDNRVTKAIFAVIIGVATLSMVLYLVPGLYDGVTGGGATPGVYATVRTPGVLGRIFGETTSIKTTEVTQLAQSLAQRQNLPAQYLPFLMPRFEQQAQQVLVASAIETREAARLGLSATDADVRQELQTGQLGQFFFPDGKFIGDDKYKAFITNQLQFASVAEFEGKVKEEITTRRLQQFVTAGATVSDNAVRELVRKQGVKVKFDYALISAADIAKTVNPIDSDLENFFKKNAARYATAVPEKRKIAYIPITLANLPGGKPQVSDADLQAYYNAHKADYHVDQQVKVRHILIASSSPATDAAAKAKAQDLLNKIKAGGDFAALAKANSDDPGSKGTGGELGYVKANGAMVPEFQAAAMKLKAGETSDLVKTSFGYHIINAEARDEAHDKTLSEVAGEIRPILEQQNGSKALGTLAQQIAQDAAKNGIEKAATDHSLKASTTDYITSTDTVSAIPDSAQMVQAAFTGKKGDAPRFAPAGQGTMVVFQTADVQPAHAPQFAEWKDHVLEDYRTEQVPAMLQAKLVKLSDRAKQLGDLHKAAAEMNVPVKSSDLVDRTGNVPEVGAMSGAASAAFDLPKGGISTALNNGQNGEVLQIVEKQEPSADEIAKSFTTQRTALLEQQRGEVFGVYMQTLIDEYTKKGAVRVMAKPTAPTIPMGS